MDERSSPAGRRDRVLMTYVNSVSSIDEDFAETLRCVRKHNLLLASTVVSITLRADRVAVHGHQPVSAVMIAGVYDGKAID